MNNQNTSAARTKLANNVILVGRSNLRLDQQRPADWCQLAITGDCLDVASGCGRAGIVTATGDAVLICARERDVPVLESLEIGLEYKLYGRLVEKPGEWNGEQITKRYFNLLPVSEPF